jgi:hypothetical protein
MTKELHGILKPSWFGAGDFFIKLEYNDGQAKWLEVSTERMLRAPSCVFWVTACALMAGTGTHRPSKLTVVMDFHGSLSQRALTAMERETEGILKPAGLSLGWRLAADAARESFENLVVVEFKGACQIEPIPYVYDELGPMAFTYSSDGNVQPFTEVWCTKVAASVRTAMGGEDFPKADVLFGRALGRVLAHELVHVLTGSEVHGREGVQRAALSGKDLISSALALSPADLARLREVRK